LKIQLLQLPIKKRGAPPIILLVLVINYATQPSAPMLALQYHISFQFQAECRHDVVHRFDVVDLDHFCFFSQSITEQNRPGTQ
jgi:hypothetical protein